MDLIEQNILNELHNYLPDPDSLRNNLNTLNEKFPSILEDFKKYYIFYNKTPDYPEYAQLFTTMKGNIQKIQSTLFSETNTVESIIEKINQEMSKIDVKIKEAKNKNKHLKKKLGIVETTNNSSEEMIGDYKKMYNLQYFVNFTMIVGIILAGTVTFKVFKKPYN